MIPELRVVKSRPWERLRRRRIFPTFLPLLFFFLFDDASAFTKSEAFQSLGCRRRVWRWRWWRVGVKVRESSFNIRIRIHGYKNYSFFFRLVCYEILLVFFFLKVFLRFGYLYIWNTKFSITNEYYY